jgi:hypothetical protein
MNDDEYPSESNTESNAGSESICTSYIDDIINQDTKKLEEYPRVTTNRRVIARVQIKSD